MKIESNNPFYKNRVVQFQNEKVKFDNKGVAEVSDKTAEYLFKNHKGFYEEGKAEDFKTKTDIKIEKFTGEVQKKYLEEIERLKADKAHLLKKVEKLEVSEKAWRENYIKLEEKMKDGVAKVEPVKTEEPAKEEVKEEVNDAPKVDEETELINRLEQLTKDELRAFAIESGIPESEIGQKREKGIIELILNKLSK